jgi:PGF-CTERM protein
MNRETALSIAAAVVVLGSVLAAVSVPSAVADPEEELRRPGPVRVTDLPIRTGAVTGETATLQVEARLSHRGNPTENVSVRFRAVNLESGFEVAAERVSAGDLSGDREVPVRTNLTVPREGGYRIEVAVYRNGERIETGRKEVRGLSALDPPYARSTVRFTETDAALPAVSFTVADVSDNRTTLALSAALTNAGDAPSGKDLEVTFVLRQAESNIVADRTTVAVDPIRPGRTATVDAEVTVPSEYNYYVDVVLWKDDVVVDSTRAAANLDPRRTLEVDQKQEEVELEVSDFETGGAGGGAGDRTPTTESQAPGFGVLPALAAVVLAALVARRWGR